MKELQGALRCQEVCRDQAEFPRDDRKEARKSEGASTEPVLMAPPCGHLVAHPVGKGRRRKRGDELNDEEVARRLIQQQEAAIQALEGLLSTQRNIKAILEGLANHMLPFTTAIEILEVQAELRRNESAREQAYREVACPRIAQRESMRYL
jgi:hypothetical protein